MAFGALYGWQKVVVLALCTSFWCVSGFDGLPQLTREEEMDVETQLKALNKPAIKSVETEDGDIFDCVDISKQPAFDHSLLKNHTIQMMPSFFPKGWIDETPSTHIRLMSEDCPSGTVPIRRTRKEDLTRAQLLPIFHKPSGPQIEAIDSTEGAIYQMAIHVTHDKYHGMKAALNVYGLPEVSMDQFSSVGICLANGVDKGDTLNIIQAGWMVNPRLFGDSKTRLYIFWTANGFQGGCYNLLCPGYVQVDQSIPIGAVIKPLSLVGGDQYVIKLNLYKDPSTSNWWLALSGKPLGYWPKELFHDLADHASEIKVGGLVAYRNTSVGPAMGNGLFGPHGPRPCFVGHIETIDKHDKATELPFGYADPYMSNRECYKVGDIADGRFYFGGPAGCKGGLDLLVERHRDRSRFFLSSLKDYVSDP